MASSKKLVYIPSVRKKTWLLMSSRGKSVYLRDYSSGTPEVIRKLTKDEAERLLSRTGTLVEEMSEHNIVSVRDAEYWYVEITARNAALDSVDHTKTDRIQMQFKREILPLLGERKAKPLRGLIQRWLMNLDAIKDKKREFNHWDHDDSSDWFSMTSGIGWQAHMIEQSRSDGRINWIDTGRVETDFFLASMELNLAIPKAANRINPGSQDKISPDALGIRRNGFFTIFEVKGPQDEKTLLEPMLQGLLGALGVYAKRKSIVEVARVARGRRPAFRRALIPKTKPSMGIHVLASNRDTRGRKRLPRWNNELDERCRMVISAFPALQYIAYSFVEPERTNQFSKMKVDALVERD